MIFYVRKASAHRVCIFTRPVTDDQGRCVISVMPEFAFRLGHDSVQMFSREPGTGRDSENGRNQKTFRKFCDASLCDSYRSNVWMSRNVLQITKRDSGDLCWYSCWTVWSFSALQNFEINGKTGNQI